MGPWRTAWRVVPSEKVGRRSRGRLATDCALPFPSTLTPDAIRAVPLSATRPGREKQQRLIEHRGVRAIAIARKRLLLFCVVGRAFARTLLSTALLRASERSPDFARQPARDSKLDATVALSSKPIRRVRSPNERRRVRRGVRSSRLWARLAPAPAAEVCRSSRLSPAHRSDDPHNALNKLADGFDQQQCGLATL